MRQFDSHGSGVQEEEEEWTQLHIQSSAYRFLPALSTKSKLFVLCQVILC